MGSNGATIHALICACLFKAEEGSRRRANKSRSFLGHNLIMYCRLRQADGA